MLLDQTAVAGLGNIYVCEALNMARIAPTKPAADVPKAKLAALVPAIKEVLTAAIAAGGSTLRDFLSPEGDLGYFAKDWRVYGREGEHCECGGTITRIVPSGRSTFFRSAEHKSALQSIMRISYSVFCLKKKKNQMSLLTIHTQTEIVR